MDCDGLCGRSAVASVVRRSERANDHVVARCVAGGRLASFNRHFTAVVRRCASSMGIRRSTLRCSRRGCSARNRGVLTVMVCVAEEVLQSSVAVKVRVMVRACCVTWGGNRSFFNVERTAEVGGRSIGQHEFV